MVASLATIMHSRPDIRPTPVMMLAEWTSPPYSPKAASGDNSRNAVPGSIRRSTRRRAGILPRAVCRARDASPPPPATSLSLSRSSATNARMTSALRAKSDEVGSMLDWSGMAFSGLWCAAISAAVAAWCHCAAALGNPELSDPQREASIFPERGAPRLTLVGPGFDAPERKVIGIGGLPAGRLLRFKHLIGDALAFAIRHGVFLGVEVNGELLLHFAGAGPAHQRLDGPRLFRLIIELPFPRFGDPRLHRVFGGLKDACDHGWWGPLRNAAWKRVAETAGIV